MRRESSIFGLAPSTPGHGDVESFGAARFDDASVSVLIRFGFNTEGWIFQNPSLLNWIWQNRWIIDLLKSEFLDLLPWLSQS